jgi:hypothetical protein
MHIIANKRLVFLKDGYSGERVVVGPSSDPQPVPDWVRETDTFKYAAKDGSTIEVEIKTPPPPAPPPASKPTPAAPRVLGSDSKNTHTNAAELAKQARAIRVAKLIRELDTLKPQMFEADRDQRRDASSGTPGLQLGVRPRVSDGRNREIVDGGKSGGLTARWPTPHV